MNQQDTVSITMKVVLQPMLCRPNTHYWATGNPSWNTFNKNSATYHHFKGV
ncbi:hypothetical protein XFPR_12375 [Xylella fastidiosa]|uniref:hypothetical protein n=1 Tax=Xylella fastidiosa TaxID=2371 RepID=UPI00041D33BD|nr:hypothetical protein [Xylella fastidiosa]QPB72978.1 hypothetical protein XFPR_12375 [Xylella fastidiosa]WGZ34644.1 hypothetical protein O4445_01655 [Xylella fastidiosa subsp. pauca]